MNAHELVAGLLDEAQALDRRFAAQVEAVRNDRRLSDEGKRQKLVEIEKSRAVALEAFRADAKETVADGLAAAKRQATELRKQRTEAQRTALGDAVYADLLRAEMSVATPAELMAMLEQAPDSFEREVVLGFGRVELYRRTADRSPDVAEFGALQQFAAAEPDLSAAEREIGRLEAFDLAQLDRRTYQTEIANLYGVRPEQALAFERAEVNAEPSNVEA